MRWQLSNYKVMGLVYIPRQHRLCRPGSCFVIHFLTLFPYTETHSKGHAPIVDISGTLNRFFLFLNLFMNPTSFLLAKVTWIRYRHIARYGI